MRTSFRGILQIDEEWKVIVRLLISAILSCSIFSILMFGGQASDFEETSVLDLAQVDADLSTPSTTSGWSDLYATGYDEPNPVESEPAPYLIDPVFYGAQADGNDAAQAGASANRDQPDGIVVVTGIVLLILALKLYFSSPGFQKRLYYTFSPLSPLGYGQRDEPSRASTVI